MPVRFTRKFDQIAAAVFIALCAVVVVVFLAGIWRLVGGAFASPSDVHVAAPELAVRDARALVADSRIHPRKYEERTRPEALPASLRISNLRYAQVHRDHVDLVLARNPDGSIGARIWSEPHRPHRDQRTRYPDIYFFRYTNELPESTENIP